MSENIAKIFWGAGLLFFTCTVVGMQYQKRTAVFGGRITATLQKEYRKTDCSWHSSHNRALQQLKL